MFIDEAVITLKSGNGGDGAVSFRREKNVAKGGPDGGSGGKGGNVLIRSNKSINTLINFNHQKIFKAQNGDYGKGTNRVGKSGDDIIINVPLGTLVRDAESGKLLADFTEEKMILFLEGGRGGIGNIHFKSSRRQTPHIALKGRKGVSVNVKLELKLLADVALVGMPNAGKSTLINTISAAKSKVGAYEFTTLEPKLGVVKYHDKNFVVSDVPGLIEGASSGKGLGYKFLKHIERSRIICHLVDVNRENAIENYEKIEKEMEKYGHYLDKKQHVIVASKIDELESDEQLIEFEKYIKDKKLPYFSISSLARKGVDDLIEYLSKELEVEYEEPILEEIVSIYDLFKHKEEPDIIIDKVAKDTFRVSGRILNSILEKYVFNRDTFNMLLDILRKENLDKHLRKAGAIQGSTIEVLDQEFVFVE